jgi:HAMP domain-containing protein
MYKELIICIIIVVLVFAGNIITQNFTKYSVEQATESLSELRDELIKEDVDLYVAKDSIENIKNEWNDKHKKLAYYIEHDELEKVETNFNELGGYIYVEEYSEAVADIDKTIYILDHIKNKNVFNLENIF